VSKEADEPKADGIFFYSLTAQELNSLTANLAQQLSFFTA